MQRFSRVKPFVHRARPRVYVDAVRHSTHSTPPVMEQVQYQYNDGYLDVMEYTAAENQFGNYFKQCLAKEGVQYQRLESAGYKLMMDEREFDVPASPQPDSPAWAYMYGNNLVDFKCQMENLTSDKEFKRGFFKHRVDALEKKIKMHYPNLDWHSRYERRLRQWKTDKEMSSFAKAKAEELAKAVAEDEEGYIALYRSNSHFNFGADDPYEYYMPADNEAKWLNHQRFEWDQTSKNANLEPYMAMMQKLELALEPNLKNISVKAALTGLLRSDKEATLSIFETACPETIEVGPDGDVAARVKATQAAIEKFPPAQLIMALTWGNLPDLFAQFFVKPGSLDTFVSDNASVLPELAKTQVKLAEAGAAMDKAMDAACLAVEKACEAQGLGKNSGIAEFLKESGLKAAAMDVLPEPESPGISQNLEALASKLKSEGSYLGFVNCMAASKVLQRENFATKAYYCATYGSKGVAVNLVAQAAATGGFHDAVARQVALHLNVSNESVQEAASAVGDLGPAIKVNEAREANDKEWKRLKLDYALVDIASLSIQYKY